MNEIWKDVEGYEGLYQVSNMGRIKGLPRIICDGKNIKERIFSIKNSKGDYLRFNLINGRLRKTIYVHRIVAEHFLDRMDGKDCINHINGIKSDNRVDNLEWCSYSENNKHSFDKLGRKPSFLGKFGVNHSCSKSINQYDLYGNFISTYNSIQEAQKITGVLNQHISKVCKGKLKQTGGFIWKYKEEL